MRRTPPEPGRPATQMVGGMALSVIGMVFCIAVTLGVLRDAKATGGH